MFRLKQDDLTQLQLAEALVHTIDQFGQWSDKALKNRNILGEVLDILFVATPEDAFPTADAYVDTAKRRLSKLEIDLNPAIEPIFKRILWNFFELHQQNIINEEVAKNIENAIAGQESIHSVEHQFREVFSFDALKTIAEFLEPSAESVNRSLARIEQMEQENTERTMQEEQDKEKQRQEELSKILEQQRKLSDRSKQLLAAEEAAEFERSLQKEKERTQKFYEMTAGISPIPKKAKSPANKGPNRPAKKQIGFGFTLPKNFVLPVMDETSNADASNLFSDVDDTDFFIDETVISTHSNGEESPRLSKISSDDETDKPRTLIQDMLPGQEGSRKRLGSLSLSSQLEEVEKENNDNLLQENTALLNNNNDTVIAIANEAAEDSTLISNVNANDQDHSDAFHSAAENAEEGNAPATPTQQEEVRPAQQPQPVNLLNEGALNPGLIAEQPPVPAILKGVVKINHPVPVVVKRAPVIDEAAAKLAALRECLDDLMWWNGKTSYKFFFGGTKTQVGNITLRVPHHNSVFRNLMNDQNPYASIDQLVDAAKKQIPSAENKFRSGTRLFGCFQVRQEPMIDLIATVATLDALSLQEFKSSLAKIRGNTPWEPIAHDLAPVQQAPQNAPGK